jgi:hypothetical protein
VYRSRYCTLACSMGPCAVGAGTDQGEHPGVVSKLGVIPHTGLLPVGALTLRPENQTKKEGQGRIGEEPECAEKSWDAAERSGGPVGRR